MTTATKPALRERPAAFARRIGVTRQRVGTMLRRGLPRGPDGLVPVAEALRWIDGNVDPCRSLYQRQAAGVRRAGRAGARAGRGSERRAAALPASVLQHGGEPLLAGYLLCGHVAMGVVECVVASVAVQAGAPMRVAYATARTAVVGFMEELSNRLPDPEMAWLDTAWLAGVDWPALAELAGEEVDLEAWERWAAERFEQPDKE